MGLKWASDLLFNFNRASELLLLLRDSIPTTVPHEVGILQEFLASPYHVREKS